MKLKKVSMKKVFALTLAIGAVLALLPTAAFASTALTVTPLAQSCDEVQDFHFRVARVKKDNKWGVIMWRTK